MVTVITIILVLVALRYFIPVIWKFLVFVFSFIWASLYSILKLSVILLVIYLLIQLLGIS